MKQVTFRYKKTLNQSESFSVGISYDGDLVFNEGTYYPALDDCEERELDYYVTVAAIHKAQVLALLLQQCTASGVDCSQFETTQITVDSDESDERLLAVLQLLYNHAQLRYLGAVEQWLTTQKIPFEKSKWLSIW